MRIAAKGLRAGTIFSLMSLLPGAFVESQALGTTWRGSVKYLSQPFAPVGSGKMGVCSYNIQWLGHWGEKDNASLANLVKNCDVIAVQELVATPWERKFTEADGSSRVVPADAQALEFINDMADLGFNGVKIAEEDTGPNAIHTNATTTEWPIVFYKKSKIKEAKNLPNGYLALKRSAHPVFDRVPYAFALSTLDGKADFVMISVHLHPLKASEGALYSKAKRVAEFQLIADWIQWQRDNHASNEQDFFVVGDMNVEDLEEYHGYFGSLSSDLEPYVNRVYAQPEPSKVLGEFRELAYQSLNFEQKQSGAQLFATNVVRTKPYDHIMFDGNATTLTIAPELEIVDTGVYFGLSKFATTRAFIQKYSDHNPLRMTITINSDRD